MITCRGPFQLVQDNLLQVMIWLEYDISYARFLQLNTNNPVRWELASKELRALRAEGNALLDECTNDEQWMDQVSMYRHKYFCRAPLLFFK